MISSTQWEEPKRFADSAKTKFDLNWLPKQCRRYAREQTEYFKLDECAVGTAMLFTGGLCTMPHSIRIWQGWEEPLFINLFQIASPGEGKSVLKSNQMKPVDDFVADWNEKHRDEITKSRQKKLFLEKKLQKLQNEALKDEGGYSELEKTAIEYANFKTVHPKKLYISDATAEKAVSLMQEQDGMLSAISAEGEFLEILLGRYSGETNCTFVLKGFSGDSIQVDRVGRASESIEHPKFAMMQLVQPVVFTKISSNSAVVGQGFFDRALIVHPASSYGKYDAFTPCPSDAGQCEYHNLITSLLCKRDKPILLTASKSAEKKLRDFANFINQDVALSQFKDESVRGWCRKHFSIMARICGILTLMQNPNARIVEAETVEIVEKMSEFFREQYLAVMQGMAFETDNILAKYLHSRIKEIVKSGDAITQDDGEIVIPYRVLSRACGKKELKRKADFVEPLQILEGMALVDFDKDIRFISVNPRGVI